MKRNILLISLLVLTFLGFLQVESFGQFTYTATTDGVSCNLGQGRIIVRTFNGGAPYSYELLESPFSPPGVILDAIYGVPEDTAVFADLEPGTYYLRVYHSGPATPALIGNNVSLDAGTVQTMELQVNQITVVSGPTCRFSSDAVLQANAAGGNPPYIYQWSATAGNQTTQQATGIAADAIYSVTVNDQNNCGPSTAGNPAVIGYYKDSPSDGGTIPDSLDGGEIDGDQELCEGFTPTDITNITSPSGGSIPTALSYSWEYQDNCAGAWTVVGSETGLELSFAGPIPNTRCYRRVTTNICGVVYSNTVTITVNPLPTVTLTPFANVCENVPAYALSGGSPAGGTYSGPGVSGGITFDPSVAGIGNHTITYTYTDVNGCVNSDNQNLRVINAPSVTLTPFADVCVDAAAFALAGGAPGGGTYSGTGVSAGDFDPSVAGVGTHTITYTYVAPNTCTDSASQPITVNPLPTVTATATPATICIGENTTLTAGGATSYVWDNGLGAGASHVVTPAATTTYTVTGTDANGCVNTDAVTVTVNPLPTITASATPATICDGDNSTISAAGGTSYTWDNGLGAGASHIVSPSVTTTYTVTGTDANGCVNTDAVTVTVNPLPTVTATATPATICIGDNTTLTAGGATSYVWDNGLGAGASHVVSPAVTTTYTVTGTDANGCVNTDAVTVTVNPLPTITASATPATICDGDNSTISATGGTSYTWDNGLGAGASHVVTPAATTTYTVTGTDANGCVNTDAVTVTVNPLPTITASATPATICDGDNSTISAAGGTSYTWDNGLGAGASHIVSPSVTTTYTVTGTDANGCVNTDAVTVTVNPLPTVTATATPATICIGDNTTLTAGGATSYVWDNGLGAGASHVVSPAVTTTYTVTGTDANGCVNTDAVTVTVNPLPTITASATPATICDGDNSTISATGGTSYTWDNGLGAGASHVVTPAATTTYTVTGTDANGCVNTDAVTVTVNPLPTITASATPATICDGDNSTISATGGTSYTWDNGLGAGASHVVTPAATTTYTVTGTDANGCVNTDAVTVTVNPLPTITASATPATICDGDNSTISAAGGTSYTWDNGLGAGASHIVSPSVTTTYTVTGTDANGCVNTDAVTVTVNPLPTVTATATPATICIGDNTTLTAGGATSYVWDNGLGAGASHVVSPAVTTTYTVTGTDANGCVNTDAVTVTVNPLPTITASATPATICDGDNSTISATGGTSYTWDNGLGAGASHVVTPAATTTYTVTGTDANGCVNTDAVTVTVNPLPTITASATPATICDGDNSTISAAGGTSYTWDNGLGAGASHIVSPSVTTTYTVTGTDANGCVNTDAVTVTVNPLPTVTATATPATICIGDNTTLTAGGATSYVWDNGLGAGASHVVSPAVTTTYTVTGTDANGCVNTDAVTVTVNPLPTISASATPATICDGDNSTISATGGTSYTWDNGLGAGASHVVSPAVTTTYTVTGTDANGCVNTDAVTVTVNPLPAVTILPNPATACEGVDRSFIAMGGAGTYSWTGSGAGYLDDPNINNPVFNSNTPGTYQLIVTLTDGSGCQGTDIASVDVIPGPQVFAGNDTAICSGSDVTLPNATMSDVATFQWRTSGDGAFDDDGLLAPTYTPGSLDIASEQVILYLDVVGNAPCLTSYDSIILTIPAPVQPAIGSPAPFLINSNTIMEVCVSTSGHSTTFDLGYYLVAPDGVTTVELKRSPMEEDFFNPCGGTPPSFIPPQDADNLCFSTEELIPLDICTAPTPLTGNHAIAGDWSTLYGMNPAEGGWAVMLKDTAAFYGSPDGNISNVTIRFVDTATATGLLKTINYNSGPIAIPIDNPADNYYIVPRGLQVSCYGECDAEAIVNVIGGTAPYVSYNWSPAPSSSNALGDSVLLCAGSYTVTVTDALGCSGVTTVDVTEPPQIVVDEAYYTDSLLCNADSDGYIVVKASGGTGTLTYTILEGNIPSSAAADSGYFPNLPAGTYTVNILDGSGCSIDTIFTIWEPQALILDTAYVSDSILCYGDGNGRIVATASGGTPPYVFMLAGVDTNSTGIFTSVPGGNHNVLVTDANGCDTITSDTLRLETPAPLFIDTVITSNVICTGDNGTLTVAIIGGSRPYRVSVDGGTTYVVSGILDTAIIGDLPAGNYDVVILDTNGCSVVYPTVAISNPPSPLTINTVNITPETGCYGDANGELDIRATGGWGSILEFSIDNTTYFTDSVFAGLVSDTYTTYVRDSLGCIDSSTVVLPGPAPLTASVTILNVQGGVLGSVTITGIGGNAPYEYWLDSTYEADTSLRAWQASGFYPDLNIGTYYIAVRDANGCMWEDTVDVQEDVLSARVRVYDPVCWGMDGSIVIEVDAATAPVDLYLFSLSAPFKTYNSIPIYDSIVLGAYSGNILVRLEDVTGVAFDTTVTMTEPPAITFDPLVVVPKTCQTVDLNGDPTHDGEVTITANGGVGTLGYILSIYNPGTGTSTQLDSNTTGIFTGLGEYPYYTYYVKDSLQCSTTQEQFEVEGAHRFYFDFNSDTTLCKYNHMSLKSGGSSTGHTVNFEWAPDTIFNDPSDAYVSNPEFMMMHPFELKLTLRDDACMSSKTSMFTMFDTVGMHVSLVSGNAFYDTASKAIIATTGSQIEVQLPSGYYITNWWENNCFESGGNTICVEQGDHNKSIYLLPPTPSDTTYTFFIEEGINNYYAIGYTDTGCVELDTIFIAMRQEISQDSIYTVFTPNGDGVNDTWVVDFSNQYPEFEVEVFNRWGQLVYRRQGYGTDTDSEWDGKSMKTGNDLPVGTYFYIIKPNDGQTEPFSGTVTIIR